MLGKVIYLFKYDLIAKYANACDSIKSPLKLYSSIKLTEHLDINFFMLLMINLFFLPPPVNNICLGYVLKKFKARCIDLTVNIDKVAAPSLRSNWFKLWKFKSFTSNDLG